MLKTPLKPWIALTALLALPGAVVAQPYFPGYREWERRAPAEAGMDADRLREAVAFATANENPAPKDLALAHRLSGFAAEPYSELVGPTSTRAAANGVVVRHGYIVAEWGDTQKVDMTFSVTKTFLSTVVGLAWEMGLIKDVHDRVVDYVPERELFSGEHNGKITWDHLLRQTSDWQGTLWGKPDWADRPEGDSPLDYPNRPLHEPGTRYKYNDVRVNLLALTALHVWRRPLPEVLRERVMDPMGASNTWRWHGYDNSWVLLDGQKMQSVSGGGHWGGGMFISALDMARFGYLFLRNGQWKDRRIVSENWIRMARTPGPANPGYGYMNWFLNQAYTHRDGTYQRPLPAAPETSVTFRGSGQNIIYIDWDNDLVVVVRWLGEGLNELIAKLLAAIITEGPTSPARPSSR